MIGGKSVPERSFIHPWKHVFGWNFLIKPAPYLFSGPNWLYGAFGDKIVPDENCSQFCLKSTLEFVFPKNTFSAWIFVPNHTSPILWAKLISFGIRARFRIRSNSIFFFLVYLILGHYCSRKRGLQKKKKKKVAAEVHCSRVCVGWNFLF